MKSTLEGVLSYLFLVICVVEPVSIREEDEALKILKRAPRVKRVIGGRDVQPGQWPSLVHLQGKVAVSFWFWGRMPVGWNNYYCGATLVDKKWAVSAAHCFKSRHVHGNAMKSKYWHVMAGKVESQHGFGAGLKHLAGRVFNRDDWRVNVHADKIFIHPQYNEQRQWENDIALIRLRQSLPVDNDPLIGVAGLPDIDDPQWPATGQNCTFLGWGCDRNGGFIVNQGQQVSLPRIADETCRQAYEYGISTTGRLCAGFMGQNRGICAGDSGGPLMCEKNGKQVLAGVASFTSADSPGDYPGVFTNVAKSIQWIKDTIRLNNRNK